MKNLWGGRFKKLPNKKLKIFNNSFYFDKRLIKEDILYSKKHVNSIYLAKIITKKERDLIIDALDKILVEYSSKINKNNYKYEDIHTFVELKLFEKIGDLAKKLHTGRSRNDQIATDIKLYIKKEILNIDSLLFLLLKNLECIIEKNTNVIMPGFTHMQKAQPIILSQYIDAYFEMFKRDRFRLKYLINSINTCPAGSGALTGTVYKINREYLANELGFLSPVKNSIDGVSDRDFIIEFLSFLSIIMMHLSRFCEEIICWNSDEYRFIEISDAYSTGSSIMPQKKNPDIAELIRGKTGRVYGDLINILTVMKALPLAYNKDMQEDKECVFDGIDTVKTCLDIFCDMLKNIKFDKNRMYNSSKRGFMNATEIADYLVLKGVSFRDAHKIVGEIVCYAIDKDIYLEDIPLNIYKKFSKKIEKDIYNKIKLESIIENKKTIGSSNKKSIKNIISSNKKYLNLNKTL